MPRRIRNARCRWLPRDYALEFGTPMELVQPICDRLADSYMEFVFQILSVFLLAYGLWITVLGLRIGTLQIT